MTSPLTPRLIDSRKAFEPALDHIFAQPLVALDTESDSFYHYYPKVCLLQVSAGEGDAARDYLIDPLSSLDLAPLIEHFDSPDVEVVMHAAENDMYMLARDFDARFKRTFDTQLAARILGWPRTGLADILRERFGVHSDKREQRTDWSRRPLSPQQLAYATTDTRHLLPLRRLLLSELSAKGRLDEAQDAFAQAASVDYTSYEPEPRDFWSLKASRVVPRDRLGLLEAVWQWREREAQRLDVAPFRVANDSVLIELTNHPPARQEELSQRRSLRGFDIRRYGQALMQAVQEGRHRPPPTRPKRAGRPNVRLDVDTQARYDALREWRTATAAQRAVDVDIVMTNSALFAIAQRNPSTVAELEHIAELTPWKRTTYGVEIVAKLRGHAASHSTNLSDSSPTAPPPSRSG